jgi:hypothetical protein
VTIDWRFIIILAIIIGVGCGAFVVYEMYIDKDMRDTCTKCITTCRPQSQAEAYAVCKVCWLTPPNGEYLDYKNPTCKPVPSPFLHRVFNLTGVVR